MENTETIDQVKEVIIARKLEFYGLQRAMAVTSHGIGMSAQVGIIMPADLDR